MISAYTRAGLFCLLLASNFVIAQDDTEPAEPETRNLMQIEVKPDKRIPVGKSAFIKSEADKTGDRYLVEGLGLAQPVYVGVFTQNAGENVRVRIVKDEWDNPEREGNTSDTGNATFKFRTFDSFKIWVTAEQETPYQLMVWIGDEIKADIPSIAVPASEYKEPEEAATHQKNTDEKRNNSDGVSFSYLELGLIGVIVLLVFGFAIFLLRKKN